jgi:hypothetical protein
MVIPRDACHRRGAIIQDLTSRREQLATPL